MKKIFCFAFAFAALVGCAKEEILVQQAPEAISFDNLFVDNATRAIDTTFSATNLPASFLVYGTTQGNEDGAPVVPIFNGVEVTNNSGVWGYGDQYIQYWINGNTYNFAAVVNGSIDNNKKIAYTAIYGDNVEDNDLLYAKNNYGTYTKGSGTTDPVPFTFSHLLSKVQFTVKNTITTNVTGNAYTYKVTDVKINNVYTGGSYDITKFGIENGWTTTDTTPGGIVKFGNVSNATQASDSPDATDIAGQASATSHYSRLLIPKAYSGDNKLTITCTITTLYNGATVDVENYSKEIEHTFEEGKAYNFVISKGNPGEPIQFTVTSINGWDTDLNDDGTDEDETPIQ